MSAAHGTLGTYASMEPMYRDTVHAHALPDDMGIGVRMTVSALTAAFGVWTYNNAAEAERRKNVDDLWKDIRD